MMSLRITAEIHGVVTFEGREAYKPFNRQKKKVTVRKTYPLPFSKFMGTYDSRC
jgi:hypothetical protein